MQNPNVNQAFIDAQKAAGATQTPFDPSKVTPPNYPGNPVIPARSMSWEGSDFMWNSSPPSPGTDEYYRNLIDDGRPWNQGYSTMGVWRETPNAASYISAPPYRTPVGPVVGPDGYAYGGIPKAQGGFQAPWQRTLDMVNPENYKINPVTNKSEYNPVVQSADVNTGQVLPAGSHFRETTLDPNMQKLKAAFSGPQGFALMAAGTKGLTNLANANAANQIDPNMYNTLDDVIAARATNKGNQNVLSGDMYPYGKGNIATYDPFIKMSGQQITKHGGAINQGDVRYMSDAEIAEFVRNGGEVEYLD